MAPFAGRPPIRVIWDLESVPIPKKEAKGKTYSTHDFLQHIVNMFGTIQEIHGYQAQNGQPTYISRKSVFRPGLGGTVPAATDVFTITMHNIERLGQKEVVDRAMLVDTAEYLGDLRSKGKEIPRLAIISRDGDAFILKDFAIKAGCRWVVWIKDMMETSPMKSCIYIPASKPGYKKEHSKNDGCGDGEDGTDEDEEVDDSEESSDDEEESEASSCEASDASMSGSDIDSGCDTETQCTSNDDDPKSETKEDHAEHDEGSDEEDMEENEDEEDVEEDDEEASDESSDDDSKSETSARGTSASKLGPKDIDSASDTETQSASNDDDSESESSPSETSDASKPDSADTESGRSETGRTSEDAETAPAPKPVKKPRTVIPWWRMESSDSEDEDIVHGSARVKPGRRVICQKTLELEEGPDTSSDETTDDKAYSRPVKSPTTPAMVKPEGKKPPGGTSATANSGLKRRSPGHGSAKQTPRKKAKFVLGGRGTPLDSLFSSSGQARFRSSSSPNKPPYVIPSPRPPLPEGVRRTYLSDGSPCKDYSGVPDPKGKGKGKAPYAESSSSESGSDSDSDD